MDPIQPDQQLQLDLLGVDVKIAEQREIVAKAGAEIAGLEFKRVKLYFDYQTK